MKRIVLVSSSMILPFLFLVSQAQADVTNDVHVTTSGGNANSNVVINNSGSTNSTSSYTTGGTTYIHVETNGQSYDYHSDTPGSVNVQSVNGKVTVNGEEKATTPVTPGPTMSGDEMAKMAQDQAEAMKKKAASQEAAIKKQTQDMEKAHQNFVQRIIDALKHFFHF